MMLAAGFLVFAILQNSPGEGGQLSELDPVHWEIDGSFVGRIAGDAAVIHTAQLDALSNRIPAVRKSIEFEVEASGPVYLDLRSYFFDSYLVLWDESGELLAEDDNGLLLLHARVSHVLEAGRTYRVDVCALNGDQGDFELELSYGEPAIVSPVERMNLANADLRHGAEYLRALPRNHPGLAEALDKLGRSYWFLRDPESAKSLFELAVVISEEMLPQDHLYTVRRQANLATAYQALGEFRGARAIKEVVLAARNRILPEDHFLHVTARASLAVTLHSLGEHELAKQLRESVLESRSRTLSENDPDLIEARAELALTLKALGELDAAYSLEESVVLARRESLPKDHSELLLARANFAATMQLRGEFESARNQKESLVEAYLAKFDDEHSKVVSARASLAVTLFSQGDFRTARALEESVLAIRERTLPEGHPSLITARANLAVTLGRLGDHEAARVLQESVLAVRAETLREDDAALQIARNNLATSLVELGEFEAARMLIELVLAVRERSLPEGHSDILLARHNLAVMHLYLQDFKAARPILESILASYEAELGHDHPFLLAARSNLASTLSELGERVAARAIEESILAILEAQNPRNPLSLLHAQTRLALTLSSLGEFEQASDLLPELASGLLRYLSGLVATSPREARGIAHYEALHRLPIALFLSGKADSSEDSGDWAFELIETLRHVSQANSIPENSLKPDDELREWRRENSKLRAELADLVSGGLQGAGGGTSTAEKIGRISSKRDRTERLIRARLARQGVFTRSIGAEAVASVLPPDSVAVGFLRYARLIRNVETNVLTNRSSLLAHVLRPGMRPVRVELGPAADLEELARSWRTALGEPVTASASNGRGLSGRKNPDPSNATHERELGAELKRRILDPVLSLIGDARTLYLCLDDFLFLVPLDALPMDEGRVGDHYRLVSEVSFARLIDPAGALDGDPSFLALGGVEYDTQPTNGANANANANAIDPSVESSVREGVVALFEPLNQTQIEVETLASLFEHTFQSAGVVLAGGLATKSALHERVPGMRFLHIATHGWFAPDSLKLVDAERRNEEVWQLAGVRETVSGLAPMTLCGLALAGANNGRNSLGRMPGILTAEELAAFDLSQCELAVLSACETNVGIRRAGQGIQSLQAALHAAGARTAITSLWKVEDAATRKLMEQFYTGLWVEGLGKAEALWTAKCQLRADGHPVRDWAAWVLSGAPE